METIYYNIDARHITACGQAEGRRASGGPETLCYACVPTGKPSGEGGKILDFASYRPAEGPHPAEGPRPEDDLYPAEALRPEDPEDLRPVQDPPRQRWLLLDLCASAAVIAVALGALIRFFIL